MYIKKIKLTGVTFGDRQDNIRDIFIGAPVYLIREYSNPHDTYAIKVLTRFYGQIKNLELGYIPREKSQELALQIDQGVIFRGKVVQKIGGYDKKKLGIIIEVYPNTE